MGEIILVTGGARSGKSSYAESISKSNGGKIAYIATAIPFDEEMKDRIKKHKDSRDRCFETIERYRDFKNLDSGLFINKDGAMLDCVTVMITNIIMDYLGEKTIPSMEDLDSIEELVKEEINEMLDFLKRNSKRTVIVTNELGMGIVPENFFSRLFRDVAGKANQLVAKEADEVYLCVSGIPVKIK